jgi:hypothetical protein
MLLKNIILPVTILISLFSTNDVLAKTSRINDDQVKQQIIEESIASYPGVCACPFNSARNGSSCGRRSAWSKAGGYAPICYKKEVTKDMVAQWRQSNNA